ncbi:MAG: S41 family peptidase [Clostridia bacterium]|nr:S41 family peptidase [Clostridia bacterium]
MNTIPDALKIYELSKIWKEAAYNFAFWDKVNIDWDEEYKEALTRVLNTKDLYDYYLELKRFAALLNDGHTDVSFPNEIYQDTDFFSMFPVYFAKPGDEIIVVGISEDVKDDIPLFSTLVKIDGTDIHDYIKENCYPYLWHDNEAACGLLVLNNLIFGRRGSGAVFTFAKDGRQFDVRLERTDPSKIVWYQAEPVSQSSGAQRLFSSSDVHTVQITDEGIAIIRITSFEDDSMPQKIYSCFDELKKAKGYIIDVRGNSGGNSGNADAIAAMFINGDFHSCYAETQRYEPTYKAWSMYREDFKGLSLGDAELKYADDAYSLKAYRMRKNVFYVKDEGKAVANTAPGKLNGPVAVLMNQYTFSSAEDFVDVMKMYTEAIFIGNNTGGTSGQPLCEALESGGFFRICTRRCVAQNGEDIYNKGFTPDIRIIPTVEDIASGRDMVLEKGLEIIKRDT